jgi:hypothetical protein
MTLVGDDKAVQIQLEPVLDSGTVDLGDQAAVCSERGSIEPDTLPNIG